MPSTTAYSFGDVVLVPFPFTDQSAAKRRPAIVISASSYNRERPDVIIMAVTSQMRAAGAVTDIQIKEWKEAGLLKPSVVKPIITTIEQSLIMRRLGRLQARDQDLLQRTLTTIVGYGNSPARR
jgi:mRNA interferase MazF